MRKRAYIPLLIGVNALLLTTLIVTSWDLPRAQAQATPLATNYAIVSAVIFEHHDAIVIVDLPSRLMFVFELDQATKQLVLRDTRDLKQDFRRGR